VIAAAAATDPYLGREILGHIEIRQLVGIGAMGRVYRAFQKGIDRDVAVKVLHRELSSNKALVARFDREAKVASRLAHPNVVHVLLVGQLPDGAMYIVMEYLDGMSLQSALAGGEGAMPLPRALHIALQLCDAAGEGHAMGIVHRDLKPENVMLVRRADDPDFVKVLDFGIARVHWGEQSMATAAGLIFGTARYISPEGAQGEQVGPAGDVYSIATILYQMLGGRTPFSAEQAVALLVQQIHDPPTPLREIPRAAYVPEAIAAVIMKNLAKKPADRVPDARALGRALLEAAVSSGLSAQDVLARPSLQGGRGSHPSAVQMPSMQRTKQLELEPETAARIGAVTAVETPAPAAFEAAPARVQTRTEIPDPAERPPSMETVKWAGPSPRVTKLLTQVPASGGVDETMDDQQVAPSRRAPLPTTVLPTGPTVPPVSAPPTMSTAPMAPVGVQLRQSEIPTAPPMLRDRSDGVGPSALRAPAPPRKPSSSVDTTIAGDEAAPSKHRPPPAWRGAAIGISCFLVGAAVMIAIAGKGFLSVGRAAPVEPIHPDFVEAPAAPQPTVDTASALPPLEPLVKAGSAGGSRPSGIASAPAGASAASPRIVVDASNPKPGVGQPLDFAARFVPRPAKVEAARFLIAGPGIAAGTELPAADDGSGVFRTTFTFLQGGRFEVDFSAKADGTAVKGARVVVVGGPGGASGPAAAPAPSALPAAPAAEDKPAAPPNANASGGVNARWL
jgi:serine/threonine-protein kinase